MLASAQKSFHDGNYAHAIEQYQALLADSPNNAKLYLELSSCLIGLGQMDEALVVAKQAANFATSDLRTACELQLANLYLRQERFDLAGSTFAKIMRKDARNIEAHLGMAGLYLKTGYPTKARAMLEAIKSEAKDNVAWIMQMSSALFNTRQTDAAIELILDYATIYPITADMASNAVMYSLYTDRKDHYQPQLQTLLEQCYPKRAAYLPKRSVRSDAIRVGFVSADFCWHPVGYFLHSFLGDLRALGVEIYLYSNKAAEDSLTQKLRKAATYYVPIHGLRADAATQLIRNDKLDILIDLSGHTAGNRLDVFCQRAAPMQISYLGYPDSTHLASMDYLITDPAHIPPKDHSLCSEKIYFLPHGRFCFASPVELPAIATAPNECNGYLTLGSFANPSKISEPCAVEWGRILTTLPDTRLKLRHRNWGDRDLIAPLLAQWQAMGIAPGRIEFHGHTSYDNYLHAYSEIDLILDTQPFSGGTTTCEALWMGVPVLTQRGTTPASRQGVSILEIIGETQWIASTLEDKIQKIRALSASPETLQRFKSSVRDKIRHSPLGNAKAFAQDFYQALIDILRAAPR